MDIRDVTLRWISGISQVSLGWVSKYKESIGEYLVSISLMYSGYLSYIDKIKKDPTNRIRTSDLRKSMINYSPPLYQLSYGRYPIKGHSGIEYVSGDGAKIKTPSPGIEPGAQT